MKTPGLTNRLNLPLPLVEAVRNDSYTRGDADFSVTQLLSPPRQSALIRTHSDEITEDASDRIWSLLGQSIHTILERANSTDIAERRLSISIDGLKVSGGMDLFSKDGTLSDYKTTTAYKFKGGKAPLEHEQQLNCYAEILRQNGEEVKALQVVAILRDWSKLEALRDADYPQTQVLMVSVPIWPEGVALQFMSERMRLHLSARDQLPECSVEEKWERPTKWAVMKKGAVRAIKLHESEEAAQTHAATDKAYSVEKRPGEAIRCKAYCSVSRFCAQYRAASSSEPGDA